MDLALSERTALVTGGGSGIGRAVALRLAEEGASVIVTDISASAAQSTVDAIERDGHEALALECDTSDEAAVLQCTEAAAAWQGPVTAACLNAGIGGTASIETVRLEDWRRIMSVNLEGQLLTLQHLLPGMVEAGGGAIVGVSSVAALISGHPTSSPAYGASKAGIVQLMRHVAARYAGAGIRANAVCPGSVRTNFERNREGRAPLGPSPVSSPIGRRAEPDEIAAPIAFLLSERASFITGHALVIDGGLTIV